MILLLGVSAMLMIWAERSQQIYPSASSYNPTGTRAFAELLRKNGYEVVLNESPVPKPEPGSLFLAFFASQQGTWGQVDEEGNSPVRKALNDHWQAGGAVMQCTIEGTSDEVDYGDELESYYSDEVRTVTSRYTDPVVQGTAGAVATYSDWGSDRDTLTFHSNGRSTMAISRLGSLFTNELIGERDNAGFALGVVKSLMPKPGRVVFIEAAAGAVSSPGLLATIGSWAPWAWMQVWILVLVIAYRLGKPFGLPSEERGRQAGGRDFADAIYAILARSKHIHAALKPMVNRLELQGARTPDEQEALRHGKELSDLTYEPDAEGALEVARKIAAATRPHR